jgi:hypothetical protein
MTACLLLRLCLYSTCGCELLLNTQLLALLHVCMILEQLLYTSSYTIAPLLCALVRYCTIQCNDLTTTSCTLTDHVTD